MQYIGWTGESERPVSMAEESYSIYGVMAWEAQISSRASVTVCGRRGKRSRC